MDCSYQLLIRVAEPLRIAVGRLGFLNIPPGSHVYTGSARRNLAARLARHRSANKRLYWHVDYLLTAPGVVIDASRTSPEAECAVNRETPGAILIRGFGASDCRAGCGSHLKFLGPDPCGWENPNADADRRP